MGMGASQLRGASITGASSEAPGGLTAAVSSSASLAVPLLLAWLLRERAAARRLRREAAELRETAARHEKLRAEERRGRTRAEQQLRAAIAGSDGGQAPAAGGPAAAGAAGSDGAGFVFHPIGTFRSCYRSRCGTPRQGGVVPEGLAVLQCTRDLNPAAALDSFAAFSHCWVLYVFHENTNLPREGKTLARRGGQQKGRVPLWQGICMKVNPPRCPDLKVGVLSCRTPHRPNPIGLSLARIVRVTPATGEVVLAGLDVVDGTPCLDLKPYLPSYESVPTALVPAWVKASYEEPLMGVDWAPSASAELTALLQPQAEDHRDEGLAVLIDVRPFESESDLRRALESTLALDIRSPLQKKLHPNPALAPTYTAVGTQDKSPFFVGDLWFHELHVTYALLPEDPKPGIAPASVRIERVEPRREPPSAKTEAAADAAGDDAEGS